jgi:uncharacterized membrane protein
VVIALLFLMTVLVIGVAGLAGGVWLAFAWLRQFAPEREGELIAELITLRASERLGRKAGATYRAMLRAIKHGEGESA